MTTKENDKRVTVELDDDSIDELESVLDERYLQPPSKLTKIIITVVGIATIAVIMYGLHRLQTQQAMRDEILRSWYMEMKLVTDSTMPADVLEELKLLTRDSTMPRDVLNELKDIRKDYQERLNVLEGKVEELNELLENKTDDRFYGQDAKDILDELQKRNPTIDVPLFPNR